MPTTVIDHDHHVDLTTVDGTTLRVLATEWESATGWALKPQGWCRGDVCVPVRAQAFAQSDPQVVDVARFAGALGRPAVVDSERRIAALGTAAADRADSMRSLAATDFTMPDLDGNPVSLHDFDRRKRLLLAWSSW